MGKYGKVGMALVLGLGLWASGASAEDAMEFGLDEASGETPQRASNDKGAPLEKALGELRWGMSKKQVLHVIKQRLRKEYDEKIRRERDIVRQDALYQEVRDRYRAMRKGFVEFDGTKTGWDVSPIASEFRHGTHESMLVMQGMGSRDHYFFINDRLWKWYRELNRESTGDAGFGGVIEMMRGQLGPTKVKDQTRGDGGIAYPSASWQDSTTRATLLDRGAETCLVFEARKTLDKLAILRRNALPREGEKNNVLEGVLMDEGEREAWRQEQRQSGDRSPVNEQLARKHRRKR